MLENNYKVRDHGQFYRFNSGAGGDIAAFVSYSELKSFKIRRISEREIQVAAAEAGNNGCTGER